MDDAPPGSFTTYNENGWISNETFLVWFKIFLEFSHPSKNKPVLLLFDGHTCQAKSIQLINAPRENNIYYAFLLMPLMQSLDLSFMALLRAYL